jgi:hypothetical protein
MAHFGKFYKILNFSLIKLSFTCGLFFTTSRAAVELLTVVAKFMEECP